MKFHIAGKTYTLKIPDRPMFDGDDRLEGLAIEDRKLILISAHVEPERRYEVLIHELMHCWQFYTAKAKSEEDVSTLAGTVAIVAQADLDRQGGVDAMMEMMPSPVRMNVLPPANISGEDAVSSYGLADRRPCGGCSADIVCGSIKHGEFVYYEPLRQYQIPRWMECEACGSTTAWFEICTEHGQPTGRLVQIPAPRVLRGTAAADWIAEHSGMATA